MHPCRPMACHARRVRSTGLPPGSVARFMVMASPRAYTQLAV